MKQVWLRSPVVLSGSDLSFRLGEGLFRGGSQAGLARNISFDRLDDAHRPVAGGDDDFFAIGFFGQ
jgi:hypothetical protein